MADESNVPAVPGKPSVAFSYNGADFAFDDRLFINLTAMWKTLDSQPNRDPRNWKLKEGKGFIADLAKSLNAPVGRIIVGTRGKGGSTWAHWQIALAYAKYLSHEFHRHVNEAFRQYKLEEADPSLKIERGVDAYLKLGKEAEWINRRFRGITARKALCATMADHNCKVRGKDNPFAEITRAMSLKILGKTPSEFKEQKGVPASASTRDHFDEEQLVSFEWAEIQARKLIKNEAAIGNDACIDAGVRAADAVRLALSSLSGRSAQ